MRENRKVDYVNIKDKKRYSIDLQDSKIGSVIIEDGSICFGYDPIEDNSFTDNTQVNNAPIRSMKVGNRGFKFRYKPLITHYDQLEDISQKVLGKDGNVIQTEFKFTNTFLTTTAFAVGDGKNRYDVIHYEMLAGSEFKTTRASVALGVLSEEKLDGVKIEDAAYVNQVVDNKRSHELYIVDEEKVVANDGVRDVFFGPGEMKEGAFILLHKGSLLGKVSLDEIRAWKKERC